MKILRICIFQHEDAGVRHSFLMRASSLNTAPTQFFESLLVEIRVMNGEVLEFNDDLGQNTREIQKVLFSSFE